MGVITKAHSESQEHQPWNLGRNIILPGKEAQLVTPWKDTTGHHPVAWKNAAFSTRRIIPGLVSVVKNHGGRKFPRPGVVLDPFQMASKMQM